MKKKTLIVVTQLPSKMSEKFSLDPYFFIKKKTNLASFLDVFYVSFVMKKKDITEF